MATHVLFIPLSRFLDSNYVTGTASLRNFSPKILKMDSKSRTIRKKKNQYVVVQIIFQPCRVVWLFEVQTQPNITKINSNKQKEGNHKIPKNYNLKLQFN